MLSPQSLEKVSHFYRKGYYAGYDKEIYNNSGTKGSFSFYDYESGYAAAV